MRSNIVRYYINDYRKGGRISISCWIHKRHPIPRPNVRVMACLLWTFWPQVYQRYVKFTSIEHQQKLSWSLEMFRTFRILTGLCPEIWVNKNPCVIIMVRTGLEKSWNLTLDLKSHGILYWPGKMAFCLEKSLKISGGHWKIACAMLNLIWTWKHWWLYRTTISTI